LTKMSPLGATSTSLGWKKNSSPAAPPGFPKVSSSWPEGLNLNTCCPLVACGDGAGAFCAGPSDAGRLSCPSVTQKLPSRSTKLPCGNVNRPLPKERTSSPCSLNRRMEGRSRIWLVAGSTQEFAPQRSPIQMLLPSLSTSTVLVAPQTRPEGS